MASKKGKTFIDKIKLDFSKLLIGDIILNLLFLLFGIIIYLNPQITLETSGIILGIYFIIFGLFAIYEYFIRDNNPLYSLNILWGILAIITGLFVIVDPFKFFKILTFALGIYLIIVSIRKVIDTFKLKKSGYDGWSLMLAIAIILLIFGIFILINPMAAMDLAEAAGIFIILASILEICNSIMLYTKAQDILKLFKTNSKK